MAVIQRHLIKKYLHSACLLLLFVGGCAFVNVSLIPPEGPLREQVLAGQGQPKILLMDVSGIISEKEKNGAGLRSEPSMLIEIKEALQKAETDRDIAGIIIRINSPGGSVTATDIIYHEIQGFKARRTIPVYACIMDTGASGGYYIATAADKIIAHPTSITGSIGVIVLKFNMEPLLTKIGVSDESIKSGDKKDILSPFRSVTPEEKELLQAIIDSLHSRFIDVVFNQRKALLGRKDIEALSDGRIFTAEQALQAKLIDRIGYLDDALSSMKKSLGIEHARVVSYYRPWTYKSTIYSLSNDNAPEVNLININADSLLRSSGMKFMYLWKP